MSGILNIKLENILDLTKEELGGLLLKEGGKKFNANQIFNWLYKKKAVSFTEMSNLSAGMRAATEKLFEIKYLTSGKILTSAKGDAVKFLFKLGDGHKIESVLMLQPYGNTFCASTQVGCAYGCHMCATGKMGLKRNLSPGEITGQLLAAEKEQGEKVNNIVFMGMGEPLANYDNFKKAVLIFSDPDGININQRRQTVSTCGVVPGIDRLISDGLRVNLSVSLHSTFDSLRDKLVPVNKKYKVAVLLKKLQEYCKVTRSHVSIEYVLIAGVNDGIGEADNLIKMINKFCLNTKVNLIPVNPVDALSPSGEETIKMWQKKLENAKIISTSRRERGADILAACGQLAGEE